MSVLSHDDQIRTAVWSEIKERFPHLLVSPSPSFGSLGVTINSINDRGSIGLTISATFESETIITLWFYAWKSCFAQTFELADPTSIDMIMDLIHRHMASQIPIEKYS